MKTPVFDAIIVAGGAGARLGSNLPKAFVKLSGKPLLQYGLEQFQSHASTLEIILVVPAKMINEARTLCDSLSSQKRITVIEGGKERWQSAKNGLTASSAEWVLVHDAARPFVTHAIIDTVLKKSSQYDSVVTATPEVDTIRRFSVDRALETVDRAILARVGTPQLFRAAMLKESFSKAEGMPIPPTDEAMLMEKMGIPVGIAWGDPLNFKITTESDLMLAEALCAYRSSIKK